MSESLFGFMTQGTARNLTQIMVDLESARSTLDEMDSLAEECLEKVKTMQNLAATLSNCWKGDSGNAVQETLTDWCEKQDNIADRIRVQTSQVRKRLDKLEASDAALAQLIRNS